MASVIMDAADAADFTRRHSGGGPLAVNKTSGKISKGLRRPIAQPRPAPTVYKIEAGEFRSLVQELTGTAPVEHPAPRSSGNARLQKFAPPPLRPTPFSYAAGRFGAGQPLQQFSNGLPPINSPTNNGQRYNNIPFSGFGSGLSPLSQRGTPFPLLSPHSFSPLPVLSPSDQVWANTLESPSSAAMRQLAQSISEGELRLDTTSHTSNGAASAASGVTGGGGGAASAILQVGGQSGLPSPLTMPTFSLSPRFSSTTSMTTQYPNLPSPTGMGMASGFNLGSIYQMGALHSPTSAMTMDFAFSDPDFMLTGLS